MDFFLCLLINQVLKGVTSAGEGTTRVAENIKWCLLKKKFTCYKGLRKYIKSR